MKKACLLLTTVLLLNNFLSFAQEDTRKIKVSGKVLESSTQLPLEYATITFTNGSNPKVLGGGITNNKGEFNIDVTPGVYNVKIEFISFKATQINQKSLTENTNLGTIDLEEDAAQLNEVVVRAESTTVQIKLDKKVYNVGQDLLVKGGTVSDVLDNIPSVTVDADGTVALRGNENVRILIDGRPSNAINISEALRQIPADAIDKVEVITNPSARYDSEGGGGLLNIILKKGKNLGVNGTVIASVGNPEGYGLSANINYKTNDFNLFTTTGYNYRNNPGNAINNTQYFNDTPSKFIDETRHNTRLRKGYNSNFGFDWYLNKSTTWTNSINLRRNSGTNPENVSLDNYGPAHDYLFTEYRFNDAVSSSLDVEYNTNFVKNFSKEGHKLTIDGSFSKDTDDDASQIFGDGHEITTNKEIEEQSTVQADYVLPFGKNNQFEAGYKGNFNDRTTDYLNRIDSLDVPSNSYIPYRQYANTLQYKENINALYTQFGTKINKFSVLLGVRMENSRIEVNQFATQDYNTKKYTNFFPSAFLTYEVSDKSSVSLSYSRRINRPRGRFLNPFPNRSSNINIFMGNPDLDPSLTDAIDLGYLKRWTKLTLSTSAYLNHTVNSFEFVRKESGDFVGTTPVIISSPINLATEQRYGFEFTFNYSPFKWWKLNSNFNFFSTQTIGKYNYLRTNADGLTQSPATINLDNQAYSYFTRLSSKVTLPYKIDWQANVTYNGPQNTAQGKNKGNASANLGFSKDVFKEKGTFALNVQDLFNSRKRIFETYLPNVSSSYSEMQWRSRQITLSFTYRFNKKKEKEKPQQKNDNGGDDNFPG